MKRNITKAINSQLSKWAGKQYLLFTIILLMPVVFLGCDSHTYNMQALELIDSINTLLISQRLCNNKNDCIAKQYVFFESAKGVYISSYGITDQSIAKKIIDLCIDAHAKNPTIRYELHMHPQTKDETLKGKSKTTMFQLILNKEE